VNKELEIWQFAAERLERASSVMLLVVAASAGSSPGRQGFKMIVASGEMCGSIGGGVMEVSLVELAKEILGNKGGNPRVSKGAKNKSFIKPQIHQKNSPQSSGMICSGKQTVIFFTLNPNHSETVREIIEALENREPKILQISSTEFGVKFRVAPLGAKPDGKITPEGVTLNALNVNFRFEKSGETDFLFEEKLGYKNNLFIVGGGHCALALSELASKMDFHISLFDDRPDLNTLAKNEFVHAKYIIKSYDEIHEHIPSGVYNFVVVMTLGYKSDEIVVKKLFDKKFKYFGVLGSKAKMKTLLRNLEKEGFAKEKLDKIHTPIGLPINSRTPEEIAVSIAAEIISVKNAG
jgi:xanthine dehydrogenase accessory factor